MRYELALRSPCLDIKTLTGFSYFVSVGDKVSSKEIFVGSYDH